MKSSSSGKTTEDSKSGRDKSPPKIQNLKTPDRRDDRFLLSPNLMRDNRVILRGSQKTIYPSDIILSVFNDTSPFKLSEIQPEITEEELQLRRKRAEFESKRGVTSQYDITILIHDERANRAISCYV
jgi:hypothetical protein